MKVQDVILKAMAKKINCAARGLLERQEKTGDTRSPESTKKLSPNRLAAHHLQGRFEFQKKPDALNVGSIIRALMGLPQSGHTLVP